MIKSPTLYEVCNQLGIKIERDIDLSETLGCRPRIIAYFPQFGGRNGLIVVNDFKEIASSTKKLIDAGYAFSTIDWEDTNVPIDQEHAIELFLDWGWSSLEKAPIWIREKHC